jgi:hypothetical protein
MIPPKDKAMELMLRYYELVPMNTVSFAKQCALIALDELIKQVNYLHIEYWKEVKEEIEKL